MGEIERAAVHDLGAHAIDDSIVGLAGPSAAAQRPGIERQLQPPACASTYQDTPRCRFRGGSSALMMQVLLSPRARRLNGKAVHA